MFFSFELDSRLLYIVVLVDKLHKFTTYKIGEINKTVIHKRTIIQKYRRVNILNVSKSPRNIISLELSKYFNYSTICISTVIFLSFFKVKSVSTKETFLLQKHIMQVTHVLCILVNRWTRKTYIGYRDRLKSFFYCIDTVRKNRFLTKQYLKRGAFKSCYFSGKECQSNEFTTTLRFNVSNKSILLKVKLYIRRFLEVRGLSEIYRVSQIRQFYRVSSKLVKIEQCGCCETNDGAVIPSGAAPVSELQKLKNANLEPPCIFFIIIATRKNANGFPYKI